MCPITNYAIKEIKSFSGETYTASSMASDVFTLSNEGLFEVINKKVGTYKIYLTASTEGKESEKENQPTIVLEIVDPKIYKMTCDYDVNTRPANYCIVAYESEDLCCMNMTVMGVDDKPDDPAEKVAYTE